ncbi:hypothetical protein Clacol_010012 [Clathrus columnatus]|uniref:Transcription factor CBF/NF-Y/archaeal histone domain-containing protein n=1 Tax=Clathrus columnatus TaxID=1419009 RepID=A0AAV5AMA5_9AGAM|nr:hypothetical protein Clacol_010012 [Clathrus columnatus]
MNISQQIQETIPIENAESSSPIIKKAKGQPKAPPPAERLPGKSLLPTARVQRIMKADKELPNCSKEGVFLISVATEEFIKRLGRSAQQQANKEKRSTVQRKDLATAARRGEEFAFLEELLSINIPSAPAAPIKRSKPKTNANANPGPNIKDVLLKVASNEQNNTEGDSGGSISGTQRGAEDNTHENSPDAYDEQDDDDSMDVS